MSRKVTTVLGWSYTLLVVVGLAFGINQAVAGPPADIALNCIGPCPPGGDGECDKDCRDADFFGGACNPANECCCLK